MVLTKAEFYDIRRVALKLLKPYLSNRKQRICKFSSFVTYSNISIGVLQGTVFGSLFFFIHDIFLRKNYLLRRHYHYTLQRSAMERGKNLCWNGNEHGRKLLSLNFSNSKFLCFEFYKNHVPNVTSHVIISVTKNYRTDYPNGHRHRPEFKMEVLCKLR